MRRQEVGGTQPPDFEAAGRPSLRGLGKVVSVGVDDEFQTVGDAELVEDRGQVMPDGRLADEEATGYVLVLQPLTDERDDLALPVGQRRDLHGFRVFAGPPSAA